MKCKNCNESMEEKERGEDDGLNTIIYECECLVCKMNQDRKRDVRRRTGKEGKGTKKTLWVWVDNFSGYNNTQNIIIFYILPELPPILPEQRNVCDDWYFLSPLL